MFSERAVLARKWAMVSLFGVFAVWCLIAFKRDIAQIDVGPMAHAWPQVLAAGALSLLNYAFRVVRWRVYMKQLGRTLSWSFVALSFMSGFAFTLSPGKLGEMVRARYYLPKGLSMSSLTGAFFVERLLDLLAMIVLAAAVLAELQAYRYFFWVAVALVGGLLAMLALVPWSRVHLPARVAVAQKVVTTLAHAQQFLSPGVLLVGLALGLGAWFFEALGLKILADILAKTPVPLFSAMGIYALAIIVGALSFLPGGLGSTEAVMTALLYSHGLTMPEALLTTLVCRLLTLWLAVLIGWLCVWRLRTVAP